MPWVNKYWDLRALRWPLQVDGTMQGHFWTDGDHKRLRKEVLLPCATASFATAKKGLNV